MNRSFLSIMKILSLCNFLQVLRIYAVIAEYLCNLFDRLRYGEVYWEGGTGTGGGSIHAIEVVVHVVGSYVL